MLFKNVAGQGAYLYAHDTVADAPKTGDAANITCAISKDGGADAATTTANPSEIDATTMKGVYWQPLSQAETNANAVALAWVSSTANVVIEPLMVLTQAGAVPFAVAGAENGLPILDADGRVAANVEAMDAGVKVTPIDVDGITFVSAMEVLLAVLAGVAEVTDNGNGTYDVAFKKRDGTTTKITLTYAGASGNRTASEINS